MAEDGSIQLRQVTKTYRLGDEVVHALDKVDITIASGEFLAITGPSGSGKSTLANIIGGLDTPTDGSVLIAGQDLSKVSDKELSRYRNKNIGFVFQSFNLQPTYTALENVMLPLVLGRMGIKERQARAAACLETVGLAERMRHKPAQLSGGQRQRVAIARALANSPAVIIADEPTGNLDSQRGEEIMQVLRQLNKEGITLIIITHDPAVAKQAHRVVSIHDGKLEERR
jgi:putative ABC transport system ATP-binding protein